MHGFGARNELASLRRAQVRVPRLPLPLPRYAALAPSWRGLPSKLSNKPHIMRAASRGAVHFDRRVQRYAVPFPGADASIVRRSQAALFVADNTPFAVGYTAYVTLPSFFWVGVMSVIGSCFSFLARWAWGRSLLLRFPRFFSLGRFSHEGPTAKQLASCSFTMDFFGTTQAVFWPEYMAARHAHRVSPHGRSQGHGRGGQTLRGVLRRARP